MWTNIILPRIIYGSYYLSTTPWAKHATQATNDSESVPSSTRGTRCVSNAWSDLTYQDTYMRISKFRRPSNFARNVWSVPIAAVWGTTDVIAHVIRNKNHETGGHRKKGSISRTNFWYCQVANQRVKEVEANFSSGPGLATSWRHYHHHHVTAINHFHHKHSYKNHVSCLWSK